MRCSPSPASSAHPTPASSARPTPACARLRTTYHSPRAATHHSPPGAAAPLLPPWACTYSRCVCPRRAHTGRVRRHLSASGARVGGVGLWWSGWVPGPRWHGHGSDLWVGAWTGGHVGGVGDRTSCAWSRVRSRVPSSVPDQSPALRAGPALLWPLRGWGPAFFGSPRSRVRKFSHEFSATKTESGWARGGADLRFVIGHMDIWIQHRCILTLCHKTHETCHAQSHSHRAERW